MSLPDIRLPWELREDDTIISEITTAWTETLQERGVEKYNLDLSVHGQMVLGFVCNGQGRSISVWYPNYGYSKANRERVTREFKEHCHRVLIEKIKEIKMNNNIQESFCSFELSKLLKEMGFNVKCFEKYFTDYPNNTFRSDYPIKDYEIYRPTHALAVEWIRINFGMWICVDKAEDFEWWKYNIRKLNVEGFEHVGFEGAFTSPHAATEAALKRTLERCIKKL